MLLSPPVRVCFVCSGNICRSPTAEVTLRAQVSSAGLDGVVEVDSAGTGDWHAGDDMDARSRSTLTAAGFAPGPHRARQFTAADFADRDVVVALDSGHARALRELAGLADDPVAARESIVLLRSFDPELAPGEDPDVGDPYYGGPSGFTTVLGQIERSTAALLAAIDAAVRTGSPLASCYRWPASQRRGPRTSREGGSRLRELLSVAGVSAPGAENNLGGGADVRDQ